MDLTKYNNSKLFPGFKDLQSYFPFFVDQIVKDPELSDPIKYECLDTICSKNITSKDNLETECFNFFESRTLIGTVCKDPQSKNSFIRVNGKNVLISWISQVVGLGIAQTASLISTILYSSNKIIRTGLLNKLLDIEAINDSYFISDNCTKYFGQKKWHSRNKPTLKDAFLTNFKYIQWSFPTPKENLFVDQPTIDLIPCRAGLIFAGEQIIFSHNLSDIYNVRRPTVFDARLYPQFEPGGTTKPLAKCSHMTGFSEYVHKPNNFKNIKNFEAETFYNL